MRYQSTLAAGFLALLSATTILGQGVKAPPAPWRGAGSTPCVYSDGGMFKCPAAARTIAIRAGHLFESKSGQMLTRQVIVVNGDKIAEVGPEGQVKIPTGAEVIDLRQAYVMPGLIDGHTHMFNQRKAGGTTEDYMLIAVQNVQNDLRAGFTAARDMTSHGNGYGDVAIRNAINEGRMDGPRYQVSTLGIVWGDKPPDLNAKLNPLAPIVIRQAEEGRAAVREEVSHGADWIKLYPAGAYSFAPDGTPQYVVTYPLPVLQAIIDETHKAGKKSGCHVYGGEGQKNAIVAGCDTIEHAFGLDQEQANMMVAKGLYYEPTLQRYTEPYMDDNDEKSTGGKYRMIPIFRRAVQMAANTPNLKIMIGSGADGATYPHGTQALDFEQMVKYGGFSPARALQSGTIINAEGLGWKDQIGSVDKGKFADIVAVSSDPLADITELQRMKFVMKGGKVIKNDLAAGAPK